MSDDILKLAERHGVAHLPIEQLFAFYRAAFNAGLEAGAKVCDDMVLYTGYDCAAAIRELKMK